nr:hypothetical protein [uncultured Cohaesibacter sp.]
MSLARKSPIVMVLLTLIGATSVWQAWAENDRVQFPENYKNGERISNLQKIGRIDSDVEIFQQVGSTEVTFQLLKD